MNIKEILQLEKKETDRDNVFSFLEGNKVDIKLRSDKKNFRVYQIESGSDFFFVLYYCSEPFLIFECSVEEAEIILCYVVNWDIYKKSGIFCSSVKIFENSHL